jgi:hypothetical protein
MSWVLYGNTLLFNFVSMKWRAHHFLEHTACTTSTPQPSPILDSDSFRQEV